MKVIDIFYRNAFDENSRRLSNLTKREFYYKGLPYRSVEHAYQTWKSGEFDTLAYNSKALKPRGYKRVLIDISYDLMVELIYHSFITNEKELEWLKANDYFEEYEFSHTIDKGYWREAFPKVLKEALSMIKNNSFRNSS